MTYKPTSAPSELERVNDRKRAGKDASRITDNRTAQPEYVRDSASTTEGELFAKLAEYMQHQQSQVTANPTINDTANSRINREPKGFARELVDAIASDSQPTSMGRGKRASKVHQLFDNVGRTLTDSQIKDIERWMFNGKSIQDSAGATTGAVASIPPLFLDTLATLARETYSNRFVLWQFPVTVFEPGLAPSRNILVYRSNFLPAPTALADYRIANANFFQALPSTSGSATDSEALEGSSVSLVLEHWGRVAQTANTRPIFIPEFHNLTSLRDLVRIANSRLVQNYQAFEEFYIRQALELSTNIVFAVNGAVNTNPASLVAGTGGNVTYRFALQMHAFLLTQTLNTLPDGHLIWVHNPNSWASFVASMESQYAPPTLEALSNIASMIAAYQETPIISGKMSGYMGQYAGFHHFLGNSFGVLPGSPTVNTVNTFLTRDSFVMAPAAIGRGITSPMQIRPAQNVAFRFGEAYTWSSIEAVGALDVDSALGGGQQEGVWRVRATDVAI